MTLFLDFKIKQNQVFINFRFQNINFEYEQVIRLMNEQSSNFKYEKSNEKYEI